LFEKASLLRAGQLVRTLAAEAFLRLRLAQALLERLDGIGRGTHQMVFVLRDPYTIDSQE
jgi:hypothetical protein